MIPRHAIRVLLVGAGGLGAPAAIALAAAGVRRFVVCDDDHVGVSNLHRQIVHRDEDAGRPKARSAADAILRLLPDGRAGEAAAVEVHAAERRFDAESAGELLANADVVIDGSDNFTTKFFVNDACVRAGVPFVHAAAIRWQGQLLGVDPGRGDPCYRCLFEDAPPPGAQCSCDEAGVVGPVVGVIGALAAEAALSLLEARPHDALAQNDTRGRVARMLVYDGLAGTLRAVRFRRNPACPLCSRTTTPQRLDAGASSALATSDQGFSAC